MSTTRAPGGRRGPGRPAAIDRESIADAALGIAAEHGVEALTLQGVAAALGVKHSALYRHAEGRNDLLRAVADRFMESVDWPSPDGDWRTYLRAFAEAIDTACSRYPGMVALVSSELWPPPRPLILLIFEAIDNLVSLGFPRDLATTAIDLVGDFAADDRSRKDRATRHGGTWDGATGALTEADDTAMAEVFEQYVAAGPDTWSTAKLDIILDGIEVRLHDRSQ